MNLLLADEHATRRLGGALARCLIARPGAEKIFFFGSLGAGKTTLISALVKTLPGGERAETGSPSFTLCNMYPTKPPVAHFDCYRQENGSADESLLDFLEEERHVVLVEWAERLPRHALPPDRLECSLTLHGTGRLACFAAHGRAAALLPCLESALAMDGA